MSQNVIFKIGTRAQFDAIVTKNQNTLYWLRDTQELYKGDVLFGKGALATETAAGLLSAEDYKKLQELIVSGGTVDLVPVDGSIVIADRKIGISLSAVEGNILSIKEDGLFASVDTKPIENRLTAVEGRLDPVEKTIDAIPEVYVAKKYEITDAPVGTLVNYGEKEIRIMCPNGAEYNLQNVGVGGDSNTYYVTFKTYAPSNDAVGYIEHLGGQSDAEILKDIKTDKYGRRYQPTWLGVATFDESTGTWNYYGKNSSADKFIGWDYQIDWYDANDIMIASDSIRINLSNEDCHHTIVPSYMSDYAESSEVEDLKAAIAAMEESYSWGEI